MIGVLFFTTISIVQASNIVYLENCTFVLELYDKFLHVRWASEDARHLHIQAVYSFSVNQTLIPGHIYPYLSQSVALIPFFVHCQTISSSNVYLPFTQCSSTLKNFDWKTNYEGTRTNLDLKSIQTLNDVPLLYITESTLLFSNCSFQSNSTIYRLKSDENFTLRIEYESPIDSSCHSCNQRTSICYENKCQCREEAMPVKLHQDNFYCVDKTRNCSLDLRRCFYSKSIFNSSSSTRWSLMFLVVLIILICLLFCLVLIFLSCLYSTSKSIEKLDRPLQPSIFTLDRDQRTPSTVSTTTDSLKFHESTISNFYNEYFEHPYPKILHDQNDGEFVLILV